MPCGPSLSREEGCWENQEAQKGQQQWWKSNLSRTEVKVLKATLLHPNQPFEQFSMHSTIKLSTIHNFFTTMSPTSQNKLSQTPKKDWQLANDDFEIWWTMAKCSEFWESNVGKTGSHLQTIVLKNF